MATAPKKTAAAAVEPASASLAVAPMAEVSKIFEAPAANVTELQDKVRALVEKGLSETRANYAKVKLAADDASNALEASYATAKSGVAELNGKAIDALRASAEANFDFMKAILGVKSPTDLLSLQSDFARKQLEMLSGKSKEISALAQKVANDSVEPIKAQVVKTFKVAL